MSPKQKKIAAKAPPPDKIDAKDFAVLKAEKAKGRGMGLQDESVQPGKVMKARYGKAIKTELKADPTKPISSVAPKASDILKKKKLPGRIGTALGIASMMVPAAYAAAKQYKDYKSAKNRDEAKVKKMGGGMAKKYSVGGGASSKEVYTNARANVDAEGRKNMTMKDLKEARRETYSTKKMAGGMAKKYNRGGGADTGTAGERKSKMYVLLDKMKSRRAEDRITERDTDIPTRRSRSPQNLISNKEMRIKSLRQSATPGYLPKPAIGKMGGGMMQRPMGYKSGTMVKARGCKLGRTRPTKMY
jgi:hypothetical protein